MPNPLLNTFMMRIFLLSVQCYNLRNSDNEDSLSLPFNLIHSVRRRYYIRVLQNIYVEGMEEGERGRCVYGYVCVYTCNSYYEKLSHMIMEAEKFHDLLSERGRPRKAGGVVPVQV